MALEINIALCQMMVEDELDRNLKKAGEFIAEAADEGALIAVLPEMFCCPYDVKGFKKYAQPAAGGKVYDFLSESASRHGVILVGGSMPEISLDGSLYNASLIFNADGSLLGRHRKVHLFDIDIEGGISFHESETISPGNEVTVINTELITMGIGICYDVRFPELSRSMVLKGAQVLIFPAAFNSVTGPLHWELLMRARALDNQLYVAGVAPACNHDASYRSYGHSLLVDPYGVPVASADASEKLIIGRISLDKIYKVRSEIPVLKQRKPRVYEK